MFCTTSLLLRRAKNGEWKSAVMEEETGKKLIKADSFLDNAYVQVYGLPNSTRPNSLVNDYHDTLLI